MCVQHESVTKKKKMSIGKQMIVVYPTPTYLVASSIISQRVSGLALFQKKKKITQKKDTLLLV